MPNVSTLIIQFGNEIEFQDITHFRGALIASLERTDVLFHNHEGDKLRYSYPLIQYKRIHKKAAVMGIGKGAEVASQILLARDFIYKIGHNIVEMQIESFESIDNEINLANSPDYRYRLHNWLPLNSGNYVNYQMADNMIERIMMLEHVLIGNILSCLKGLDIYLKESLKLNITDIKAPDTVIYKNLKLMAFDVEFKANITLPQYIGIGKSASVGCGMLTRIAN